MITGWIFSGWPQIFNFPPKIQEALAGTVTYDTAATHVWHSPVGVTSVDVECWGGGGAGGGSTSNKDGAGGGGGGAYAKKTGITINDDTDYNVIVGVGGTAVDGAAGGNGGESKFDAGADVLAKPGLGGGEAIGTGGVGGAGGTGSTGVTTYDGGAGGYGVDANNGAGGPGGTSAGTGSIGVSGDNPWTSSAGLTAPTGGGDGGAGHPGVIGDGSPGVAPGGGGGGSSERVSISDASIGGNGAVGKCILTWTDPPTSTLSTGTDPDATTIAPGASETDVNQFVITTNTGIEAITEITVNLSTASGVARLSITNSGNTELGFTTSPSAGSNAITITETNAVTDPGTTFKVRATPKSHVDMDAPAGAEYAITAPVTAWNGGNTHDGSDDNANALTIDNLSPNGADPTSGSAGDEQVTLGWTTSDSSDFNATSGSVIYRWTASSAGSEVPAEGSTATIGAVNGTATTACVVSSGSSAPLSKIDGSGGSAECTTAALTNDQDYSYKVFQKDSRGNYDAGVLFTSSPFTPSGAFTLSFSITNVAVGFGTWPDTNKRWANSAETGHTADPGAGEATQLGASTNSTSGLAITVKSANAGLYKSYGTTHLIDAVGPTSVANATEGYAIYGANASSLTVETGFAIGGTTALTTSAQTFASATGVVSSGTVDVKPIAGITNLTAAGSYTDSLTFICTGNF